MKVDASWPISYLHTPELGNNRTDSNDRNILTFHGKPGGDGQNEIVPEPSKQLRLHFAIHTWTSASISVR